MAIKEIRRVQLVKGGDIIKQGETFTLGFLFFDANDRIIQLASSDAVMAKVANNTGVILETSATKVENRVEFSVNENIGYGEMRVEFTVTSGTEVQKYPASDWIRLKITPSLDDTGIGNVYAVTATEMFSRIEGAETKAMTAETKAMTAETKAISAETTATNVQRDFDQILTEAGDSNPEIVAARLGEDNLRVFNEKVTTQLEDKGIPIESFGAVGDSVADDTTAFQTAIANVPDGARITLKGEYLVKDPMLYNASGAAKKNITFSGQGQFAKIKIKPNITDITSFGNLTGLSYYVRNYYEEFSVATLGWKIHLHQVATGKLYDYIAVADKTQIPSTLKGGVFIRGKTSRIEHEVASVDTNDPDGVGTARIYLFEGVSNEKRANMLNKDADGILVEDIQTILDLGYNKRYLLDFGSAAVPSPFAENRKITQISGKTARIQSVGTFVDRNAATKNIVIVDSFSEWQNIDHHTAKPKPLNDNEDLDIKKYTVSSASFGSLNKYENVVFENIVFDGSNYEVALKFENGNSWNILYAHASKNVTLRNCIFKNSIMAGVQIGYAGNYFAASRDFSDNITIEKCYFENNGRGDIEIISAKKVSLTDSYGDGKIDIEPNANEAMEHISVTGCSFKTFDCYSPSHRSASTKINVANSFFDNVISQMAGSFNMVNSVLRVVSAFAGSSSKFSNCRINRFGTPIGSCAVTFSNCEVYDLPRTNSGSEASNPGTLNFLEFINSTIDLSLVADMANNSFGLILTSSKVVSRTRLVTVTRSNCRESVFKNSDLINVHFASGNSVDGYNIQGGKLLVKNLAVVTKAISGTFTPIVAQGVYIQASVDLTGGSTAKYYDCILDGNTKPVLSAYAGIEANGIKSSLGKGIDWQWVRACTAPGLLKFNNVSVASNVPSNLGVGNGFESPSVNNVANGCTALYMNDLTRHAAILFHNAGVLGLKYVNYA